MKSGFIFIFLLILVCAITGHNADSNDDDDDESEENTTTEHSDSEATEEDSDEGKDKSKDEDKEKDEDKDKDKDKDKDEEDDAVLQKSAGPKKSDFETTTKEPDESSTTPAVGKMKKIIGSQIGKSKEGYKKLKSNVKDKAKKIADFMHLNELLHKLDVRNITQLLPFYHNYRELFKKKYKDKKEEDRRMGFFKGAITKIKEHNQNRRAKFQQGINELSDLSFKEILKTRFGLKRESEKDDKVLKASASVPPVEDRPEEWDWRKYGILTEPRNQGSCGSCWSFAAATVIESHNMKRLIAQDKFDPKNQITISEQNLIDCSTDFGTIGCDGGMPQQAFKFIAQNGVNSIQKYPYKGKKERCDYDPDDKLDVTVKEPKRIKTGADEDLATAIYNYGPVAIAIHVTQDMTHYGSGVFDDPTCDPKKVNHAVVAVGYSKDYFIIRNSWGPRWGEGGYFKIARSKINNCGISQQGYYPILPEQVETKDMKDKLKETEPSNE